MSELQNNNPRQAAVNALISWAKTAWGYYTMRDTNRLSQAKAERAVVYHFHR